MVSSLIRRRMSKGQGVMEQDYEKVLESLEQDLGQAQLVFSERNTTLLHAAAYDGQIAAVKRLIALGANVNAIETNGRTPLHNAANNGHLEIMELLVRAGADMEIKDHVGMTPLMWARISRLAKSNDEMVAKLISLGAKNE